MRHDACVGLFQLSEMQWQSSGFYRPLVARLAPDEGAVLRPIRNLSDAVCLYAPLNFRLVLAWPGYARHRRSCRFFTRKVSGMLGLFSNKRVLIAFAILTAVLAIALLVVFNII
jgi:hypothetical protein